MTTTEKILVAAMVGAAVGAALFQRQQVTRLVVENRTIQERLQPLQEQVQTLRQERERLRTEVQQAKAEVKRAESDTAELLRLRGEVGPLRQAARELKELQAGQAAGGQFPRGAPGARPAGGPAPELDVDQMVMLRAQNLWQKLSTAPTNWIPELQLLKEDDWRKVALGQRWETDEETRRAFSQLRNSAKERFIEKLGVALQNYGKANPGQTPTRLADVAPYLDASVDAAILDRYELTPQRDIPNVRLSENPDELIIKEKSAMDAAAGENLHLMNLKGNARGAIGGTRPGFGTGTAGARPSNPSGTTPRP